MNRRDFLKVIGADTQAVDYLPVACLLRSGYGCAGYFNTGLNQALDEVCMLLNARLISINPPRGREQAPVQDFDDFLEEVVLRYCQGGEHAEAALPESLGKSIPLAAIRYDEIVVLYPVAHMGKLMRGLKDTPTTPPAGSSNSSTKPAAAPTSATSTPTPQTVPTAVAASLQAAAPRAARTRRAVSTEGSRAASAATPTVSDKPAVVVPSKPAVPTTAPATASASADEDNPRQPPAWQTAGIGPLPTFLDIDRKSVILNLLRTKIW